MAGRDTVENVDVNLTATDKASRVVDDVAKKVAGLDDVDLEVTADDKASKTLDTVDADARALDTLDPELTLTMPHADRLKSDIHDILTGAHQVDTADAKLDVEITGADKAKAKLDDVAGAADHANERSHETGGLRDISGALGDIGTTGLDAADGLIGIGETLEQVAPQYAGIASALGGIGLAVGIGSLLYAGLQALPGLLGGVNAKEKETKESTEKLTKAFLDQGSSVAAFNKHLGEFLADNPAIVAAMNDLGISAQDISNVVHGQTSPAIDQARGFLQRWHDELADPRNVSKGHNTILEEYAKKLGVSSDALRTMIDDTEKVIGTTDAERAATQKATEQVDAYNTALDGLPGRKMIEIIASDGGSLQEIIDRYNQIKDKQITVDVLGHVHVGGAGAMAGTPYWRGGPLRVGEAGPEDIWLPRGARVDTAGTTANRAASGAGVVVVNNYVTVNVPVGTPTAEVGRYVADALDAHERRAGPRRKVI